MKEELFPSGENSIFFRQNRHKCLLIECRNIDEPEEIASAYKIAKYLDLVFATPVTIEGRDDELFSHASMLADAFLLAGYRGIVIAEKNKQGIFGNIIKVTKND